MLPSDCSGCFFGRPYGVSSYTWADEHVAEDGRSVPWQIALPNSFCLVCSHVNSRLFLISSLLPVGSGSFQVGFFFFLNSVKLYLGYKPGQLWELHTFFFSPVDHSPVQSQVQCLGKRWFIYYFFKLILGDICCSFLALSTM